MNNQNLWWSYDPDNRSFSALPAGPLLLPALAIFIIVASIRAFKQPRSASSVMGGHITSTTAYKNAKERHDYLISKKIAEAMGHGDGLTLAEECELRKLQKPGFAGGSSWFY